MDEPPSKASSAEPSTETGVRSSWETWSNNDRRSWSPRSRNSARWMAWSRWLRSSPRPSWAAMAANRSRSDSGSGSFPGSMDSTPMTKERPWSGRCRAFASGKVPVPRPAGCFFSKAQSATPRSLASSGSVPAGCGGWSWWSESSRSWMAQGRLNSEPTAFRQLPTASSVSEAPVRMVLISKQARRVHLLAGDGESAAAESVGQPAHRERGDQQRDEHGDVRGGVDAERKAWLGEKEVPGESGENGECEGSRRSEKQRSDDHPA